MSMRRDQIAGSFALKMPCCGALEVLRWREHMKWDTPDGEVFAQCPACGERVSEHHKTTMLMGAQWQATAKGDGITAGFPPAWLVCPGRLDKLAADP